MAGLLDGWGDFIKTPEGQGLLSAAFGGLAGARKGQPINSIGRAGLAGLSGYAEAQDQQGQTADRAFKALQQQRQQQEWAKSDKIDGLASQFYNQGGGGATGQVNSALPPDLQIGALPALPNAKPAGFDAQGYGNALMGIDPIKGVAFQQSLAKDSMFGKVDAKDYTPESVAKFAQSRSFGDLVPRSKAEVAPNGMVFDPYSVKPGTVFADPNKPFSIGANGAFAPNAPFQSYEIGKAKAGASNTSIKVENKMGEGLASQVGPMMKDSVSAAEGAAKQIDAANRIISAVDSNKMFAGTGAELRLTAAQLGDTLGIGGNTNSEKIANTRQALQGLSQLTLQGRAQMRGQGAITESESKLAERATSGDISMTPGEIKQLANAAKRAANYMQAEHTRKVQVIKANPDLAGMAPFYDVSPVPAQPEPAAAAKPTYRYINGKLQKVN